MLCLEPALWHPIPSHSLVTKSCVSQPRSFWVHFTVTYPRETLAQRHPLFVKDEKLATVYTSIIKGLAK